MDAHQSGLCAGLTKKVWIRPELPINDEHKAEIDSVLEIFRDIFQKLQKFKENSSDKKLRVEIQNQYDELCGMRSKYPRVQIALASFGQKNLYQ